MSKNKNIPLVVDLDGTLIRSDILIESALILIKINPLYSILILWWLLKGKAYLKWQIAKRVAVDVKLLPYNVEVLSLIKSAKSDGRKIILATASHKKYADQVAEYIDLFDAVIATNGDKNISGKNKANILQSDFPQGFSYVGNDVQDLHIWKISSEAIAVNASKAVIKNLKKIHPDAKIIATKNSTFSEIFKLMRPHQWVKNILLFVPLIAAHKWSDIVAIKVLIFSFISFCLCSSSAYIVNDIFDIEADRKHRSKKNRPFTSGKLSFGTGVGLIFALLSTALLIANFLVSTVLIFILLGYFSLTIFYSLCAKRIAILDVIILSNLYTARILAGGVIIGITVSSWMLIFSVFLFLSLAFVKRYTEILVAFNENISGNVRSYIMVDKPLIMFSGICSGFVAVLVLGLYLNSPEVVLLYKNISIMWILLPLLIYWLLHIWLVAGRGNMHDDPIIFALRDKISFAVALAALIIVYLGL